MLENKEIWMDIKGYPNYQISNMGRVWSKKRQIYLNHNKNQKGYHTVCLCAINGKVKREQVSRLVALHFIPNPNNYPCVNHKDENKDNNTETNLEWCSRSYNINYGTRNERDGQKKSKPVRCIETGIVYKSGRDASLALGVHYSAISNVLRGKQKTLKGYHFELVNTK